MNLKSFYVATLQSALDLGVATPDDILRHVTTDVLAEHLPRPLWARLLTACVGAPRVDAQLVLETIGVANLCEHVPASLMWAVIQDVAQRALGQPAVHAVSAAASGPTRSPLTAPPPEVIAAAPAPTPPPVMGPSIPAPSTSLADVVAELEAEDRPSSSLPSRGRVPTQQRFRQSNTGIGRLASARRPQAQATPAPEPVRARRGETEAEETETVVGSGSRDDWRGALAVDDEQLVEWSADGDDRKR